MPRLIDHAARRAEIAEALWRVVVRDGIAAVSVRTVAEEAGVATGSLRHVFRTRTELMVFSAELMIQRATDRITALPEATDERAHAIAVIRELLPLSEDSRDELDVNLGLIAESTSVPELIPVRDHAARALEDACVRIVGMLNPSLDDRKRLLLGQRLHALTDGLAIHMRTRPAGDDPAWALTIVDMELDAVLAQR